MVKYAMTDFRLFVQFLLDYFRAKILNFGHTAEKLKDLIVAFLIVKRGKYSSSFLNTSFLLLVVTAFVAGPIIVENNPFNSVLENQVTGAQAAVLSYNPYENSLTTIFSVKPRSKIENYTVTSGDTLETIAKKFGISIDTIKWANNLKTDTININDVLKIPPVTGVVHKVIAGENIYTIAKKYKTTAQNIVNFPFNDFTDLENFGLAAGQTLYVPDGVVEEEQPRYSTQQYFAQAQAGVKGSSNFIWPASGVITQYPAWYHMALDIANSGSPPILAADAGTIIYAGCLNWGYGCHIIIDHGNGYKTLYGHMSAFTASAGQVVVQGQQIGVMGSTGRSTGTHLHFEIRSGDTLLNPQNFLK